MAFATRHSRAITLALCVVFLAMTLAGQAAADRVLPPSERTSTVTTLGRAGFSYLTGLRTFAAAVLWNRIEPIMHDYYSGVALKDQHYMLPTIYMVIALNPNLLDPYFVGSWVVARSDHVDEGLELARQGLENNPRAGLMLSSYAQMLMLYKDDYDAAVPLSEELLGPEITWRTLQEQYEGYAIARDAFKHEGMTGRADEVQKAMDLIGKRIDELQSQNPASAVPGK